MSYFTIKWCGDRIRMIDQRRLPQEEVYNDYLRWEDATAAITDMVIRGAPAIGIAGAMTVALAAKNYRASDPGRFISDLRLCCKKIKEARPTAVNLAWAVNRMERLFDPTCSPDELCLLLEEEAEKIYDEDVVVNRSIGEHGATLIDLNDGVMTYCNAGSLAVSEYGTALAVIRSAHAQGKNIEVFAPETRPYLQGARLTSWELKKEGIPVTLITDNMAAWIMASGKVQKIVVGADRVALNGDVANKIGTYGLGILAKYHGIPLFVAAPLSTIDPGCAAGKDIPIEERSEEEVLGFRSERTAPVGMRAFNPAFDVTPGALISAIITERGIVRQPYLTKLAMLKHC